MTEPNERPPEPKLSAHLPIWLVVPKVIVQAIWLKMRGKIPKD